VVSANRQKRITIQASLLFIGLLTIMPFFIVPGYIYGSPQKLPSNHSFILSEESPSYVHDIYGSAFGISSLQTNDTPVHMVIRHQDQVVFNATNIHKISNYEIEIPISSPYVWELEIVRQDTDVSVDITTYFWATPVTYVMAPHLLIFVIAGVALSLYALYSMFNSYRSLTSGDKKGANFLAIVMLLLLGTLFFYPLANGVQRGNFVPVTTFASLSDESYQFVLNGTHPTSSLNLSLLYPEGDSSVSFKIHSLTSSEYPLQLSIITSNMNNLTLEEESDDNDWWITIPLNVTSPSVLSFERIGTDLNGEFSIEVQYRTLAPREDILLPALFGVFGLIAIIGGFIVAYRIER